MVRLSERTAPGGWAGAGAERSGGGGVDMYWANAGTDMDNATKIPAPEDFLTIGRLLIQRLE
jgi:hypothetical protein